MVNVQQLINSSLSLRLASALARSLPRQVGYPVAYFIAEQIARRRDSKVVQAMRANQWVIQGQCLDAAALDEAVRETLRYSARCIFDIYHYIHDLDATGKLIVLEPSFRKIADRPEFDDCGLMVVGLHISNFDLVLQWICQRGLKPLILTIPDPQGARRLEYEMRKRTGMNLLPASVSALKRAIKHLQQGGMVLTGADRPVPDPEVCPSFFGCTAALPVHHVFLATRAHVPLVVAVTYLDADGKYHAIASDLIEMDHYPNHEMGLLRNAEKVLVVAEQFIQQVPLQWSVPLPVWPQILDLVPS